MWRMCVIVSDVGTDGHELEGGSRENEMLESLGTGVGVGVVCWHALPPTL